jgi:Fic family protein
MIRKVRSNKYTVIQQDIKKLRDRLGNLTSVTNAEWYSLFKEEIRHSLAIDGVFVNRKVLLDVLENNKRTNQKEAAILGYYEAARTMYEYANNQFKENEFVLRMADIKQIHTLLLRYENDPASPAGQAGEFRRNDIQAGPTGLTPISKYYVREAMEQLIKWFNESLKNKTYDPVTLAAITHVWFEKIHPFNEGNGRVGRILLSHILIGQGLVNVAIKGSSKQEQKHYHSVVEQSDSCFKEIHRLIATNEKLDPSIINNSIKKESFALLVQMISGLIKKTIDRLEKGRTTHLSTEAVLPLRHLAKMYDYSQDYLRNLINRGQVDAHKKGKLWYVRVQDLERYINSGNLEGEDPSFIEVLKEVMEEDRKE